MPPAPKRRKKDAGADDALTSTSLSRLKAQIRQATRLLALEDVKLDVRQTTERRLEALQTQLELAQGQKREQKLATRYHGLRFIERKKVLRKLNRVKKELAASDESGREALKASLRAHRIDLHYIMTFPKDRKYIAIYPDGEYIAPDAPVGEGATERERAAMRKSIKERMKHGELEAEPELHLDGPRQAVQSVKIPNKAKRKADAAEGLEKDEFFDI